LLLGAFAKVQKAIISFIMFVCVRGTEQLQQDGFSWS